MSATLRITNLEASIEDKAVLKGITLEVPFGEIHAIMGPNGSGKTTLSQVIMGHPAYEVTGGTIEWVKNPGTDDESIEDITDWSADKRAQLGVFLAFQYPREIPGVKLLTFLRSIYTAKQKLANPEFKKPTIREFKKLLAPMMESLQINESFLDRYLNSGFSGGEKKKSEMLQMSLLQPNIAVLDETDSGLDVDALRIVCDGVNALKKTSDMGVLMITHYNRILQYIQPDVVHVLIDGKIVKSGGKEFAAEVEEKGYDWLREA